MTEVSLQELDIDALAGRWELDGTASSVRFRHKTMWGLMTVKGVFTEATGSGEIHADGTIAGSLQLGAASLDTGHAKRDTHLRSADFFDVERYSTIAFDALSAAVEGSVVHVRGALTVRGIRKPLEVDAHIVELDSRTVVMTAETAIDRAAFGMSWNQLAMMRGSAAVTVKAVLHRIPSHTD